MNYKIIKRIVLTAAVATASTCLMNTGAVAGMFMKVSDIKGDTVDKTHQGQIDITSFQWGLGRAVSTDGQSSGCASISEATVTKSLDSATPRLISNALLGKVSNTIEIAWSVDGTTGDYLKLIMTNAQFSGYSVSSGGDKPSETLSIHFENMRGEYRPIDKKGNLGSPITWDVKYDQCR